MIVYIYKPSENFPDDWLYAADQGFKSLNATIKYFTFVEDIPYARDNVVVGYIEDTIKYFQLHNIQYPSPMNIPDGLNYPSIVGRRVFKSVPFKEVREICEELKWERVFIKPADKLKGFTAGVCDIQNLSMLIELEEDTNVMLSEVVDMKSEYRCFIYADEVLGMKHYSGDFRVFPDIAKIESMARMMAAHEDTPICYTLDVAVIQKRGLPKQTVAVECNDFWSVTNYGFECQTYARMLRDRFFQLTDYRKF